MYQIFKLNYSKIIVSDIPVADGLFVIKTQVKLQVNGLVSYDIIAWDTMKSKFLVRQTWNDFQMSELYIWNSHETLRDVPDDELSWS